MTPHKLAVFGNPVSHSRSPEIHQAFARQAGIEISYERILAPLEDFHAAVDRFVESGGSGFNVTLPFKEQAYHLMTICSAAAEASRAVNTVTVDYGKLKGANTDGGGLVRDITANLGWPLHNQRILILGAGGAVRGVLEAVLRQAPASIDLYNRTPERAEDLVDHYRDARLQAVRDPHGPYDLIINGTSAGLEGRFTALPDPAADVNTRCYDMVYGGGTTPFGAWCRKRGCRAVTDGLGMLVEQAALSFCIWFGFEVKTAPVIESMRASLKNANA